MIADGKVFEIKTKWNNDDDDDDDNNKDEDNNNKDTKNILKRVFFL